MGYGGDKRHWGYPERSEENHLLVFLDGGRFELGWNRVLHEDIRSVGAIPVLFFPVFLRLVSVEETTRYSTLGVDKPPCVVIR